MTWRVARSLDVLLDQFNTQFPNRSKASDGSIGDVAHQAEGDASDHNPWYPKPNGGIVTARDFTHDPAHGMDIDRISDELAASRDPRIKYMIANRMILDTRPQFNPWKWMPYAGADPHTNHLHLSVMDSSICDDPTPWNLPSFGGDMPLTNDDLNRIKQAVWNEIQFPNPSNRNIPDTPAVFVSNLEERLMNRLKVRSRVVEQDSGNKDAWLSLPEMVSFIDFNTVNTDRRTVGYQVAFNALLDAIHQDKGIDADSIKQAVEEAIKDNTLAVDITVKDHTSDNAAA